MHSIPFKHIQFGFIVAVAISISHTRIRIQLRTHVVHSAFDACCFLLLQLKLHFWFDHSPHQRNALGISDCMSINQSAHFSLSLFYYKNERELTLAPVADVFFLCEYSTIDTFVLQTNLKCKCAIASDNNHMSLVCLGQIQWQPCNHCE